MTTPATPHTRSGFDIRTDDCSEDLRYHSSNHPYMQNWWRWKVGFIWANLPFSTHFDMHVNLHGNGLLTFCFEGWSTCTNEP